MNLEMVLNELSLRPLAHDKYEARERMANLLQTILAATSKGVQKVVRTNSNLDYEDLAPDYPLARWRNDESVDIDSRRYFRSLVTKAPFLEDVTDLNIQNSFILSDSFHSNERAVGLAAAYWLEALAISLRSESRWDNSHLQIILTKLDDNGDMIESIQDIIHASTHNHVVEHFGWIRERLQSEEAGLIRNGGTIWEQKEAWFPNLYFCPNVQEQLIALGSGNQQLKPIMKKLHELEDYCASWHHGPFNYNFLNNITRESEATLEMYGTDRTFLCHDGTQRLFSLHARLTPGAWRLYFFPLPEERKLIIGYVGPHLRTQLFPH